MRHWLEIERALPVDAGRAELVGRVWSAELEGPVVVRVHDGEVYDLSPVAATCSQLLNLDDPPGAIRAAGPLRPLGEVAEILRNSDASGRGH